jgi:hypothetical protein
MNAGIGYQTLSFMRWQFTISILICSFFTTIFQIIIANLLAIAIIADTLPFLKLIRIKKSRKGVESFIFTIVIRKSISYN